MTPHKHQDVTHDFMARQHRIYEATTTRQGLILHSGINRPMVFTTRKNAVHDTRPPLRETEILSYILHKTSFKSTNIF